MPIDRDARWRPVGWLGGPGAVCPAGAVHGGGVGTAEVCVFGRRIGLLYLTARPDGATVADVDDPAEVCPDGFALAGGLGGDVACTRDAPVEVAVLLRDRRGRDVDALPSAEDACPPGWWIAGWQGEAAVCGRDRGGTVLSIGVTPEDRWWSLDGEAELCPDGWSHLGGASFQAVCGVRDPHDVVILSRDPAGRQTQHLMDVGDVCPAGFTWVGSVGWNARCVR